MSNTQYTTSLLDYTPVGFEEFNKLIDEYDKLLLDIHQEKAYNNNREVGEVNESYRTSEYY